MSFNISVTIQIRALWRRIGIFSSANIDVYVERMGANIFEHILFIRLVDELDVPGVAPIEVQSSLLEWAIVLEL